MLGAYSEFLGWKGVTDNAYDGKEPGVTGGETGISTAASGEDQDHGHPAELGGLRKERNIQGQAQGEFGFLQRWLEWEALPPTRTILQGPAPKWAGQDPATHNSEYPTCFSVSQRGCS